MATPDTRSSLVVVKEITYRGGPRRWSNRYHFDGGLALTDAEWTTFADLVVADEADIYETGQMTIVEAIGYDASTATGTNPHGLAVWNKVYATDGTQTFANRLLTPGDAAAVIRYSTDARSVKNHPIYLFNYYHGVFGDTTSSIDNVNTAQAIAYGEYAADWLAGYNDGTNLHKRCGPRGAVAQSGELVPFVRHRDFPT